MQIPDLEFPSALQEKVHRARCGYDHMMKRAAANMNLSLIICVVMVLVMAATTVSTYFTVALWALLAALLFLDEFQTGSLHWFFFKRKEEIRLVALYDEYKAWKEDRASMLMRFSGEQLSSAEAEKIIQELLNWRARILLEIRRAQFRLSGRRSV